MLTFIMSSFVLLSCGSLYSVYLNKILSMSEEAYWNSLLFAFVKYKCLNHYNKKILILLKYFYKYFFVICITCKHNKSDLTST